MIVDDEPLAQKRLVQILSDINIGDTLLTAENGLRAIEICQTEKPDVVLMDIRMPGVDGLEAAEHICQLDKAPAIIFITAYDEYALEAFKVHAVDYLLKPVREEKLKQALEHACQLNRAQISAIKDKTSHRKNITAKISGNIKLIPLDNIYYFLAEQKYVTVKHTNGETIIEDTLKELQVEFEEKFIRVHRKALVSKKFIAGTIKDNKGKSFVVLKDCDDKIEISRRHLSEVKKLLLNL